MTHAPKAIPTLGVIFLLISMVQWTNSPPSLSHAQDAEPINLRILWFDNNNESDILDEQIQDFIAENPNVQIEIDIVPYSDITTTLEQQIADGTPPDLVRITELGRFRGQYLDLRPYLNDANAWEANFEPELLNAMRHPADDNGLYGYPTDITISAPFINRTLFEQAGVPVPSDTSDNVTWETWIEATRQVQSALSTDENPVHALALDRSGHRFWGPSLSRCATYFDMAGNYSVDTQGFRDTVQMLYDWHTEGLTPLEIWTGGGEDYQEAKDYFIAGQIAFYFSGSWQVSSLGNLIADSFVWEVVPNPVGDCGQSGMVGGSVLVGLNSTPHPETVGLLIDYLTQSDNLSVFYSQTFVLPGSIDLIESGVKYDNFNTELNTFIAMIPDLLPEAYVLQYHPLSGQLHGIIRTYLIEVMSDFITIDEAIEFINQDSQVLLTSEETE